LYNEPCLSVLCMYVEPKVCVRGTANSVYITLRQLRIYLRYINIQVFSHLLNNWRVRGLIANEDTCVKRPGWFECRLVYCSRRLSNFLV
jgi:hypothetical protein